MADKLVLRFEREAVSVVAEGGAVTNDSASPANVRVEASEWCERPWLLDVSAAILDSETEVFGSLANLRLGGGRVQQADFDTSFGAERVLLYGETSFDARVTAGEIGIIRSSLERSFGIHLKKGG